MYVSWRALVTSTSSTDTRTSKELSRDGRLASGLCLSRPDRERPGAAVEISGELEAVGPLAVHMKIEGRRHLGLLVAERLTGRT